VVAIPADRNRAAHRGGCVAVHPRLDCYRGVLLGVLFLFGRLDEFLIASVRSNWRWLHVPPTGLGATGGMRRARHCLMLTGPARLSLDTPFECPGPVSF